MPRYRFNWDNVDQEVLEMLCQGEDLEGLTPAESMRVTDGARPTEAFVADHWEILREEWLPGASESRVTIATTLQAWGLGDTTLPLATEEDQIAYLRTCRNSASLRRLVLAEFIAIGEPEGQPIKEVAPSSTWEQFTTKLAVALAGLESEQFLILSVRGTGTERDGAICGSQHFVQFARGPQGELRAEAVANAYLVGAERLSAEKQQRLAMLGWQPPTYAPDDPQGERDEHGSPNWFRDWETPVIPYEEVALLATTTLHEIYGATRPAFLEYTAFNKGGGLVDFPDLGLVAAPPEAPSPLDIENLLPSPENPEELFTALAATYAALFDGEPPPPDDDGDFLIQTGSTMVFARVLKVAPVIRVFAPVLQDLCVNAALIECVNDINYRYMAIKAFWDGTALVLAMDVPARPYVQAHVINAIQTVGKIADELDDELQTRFGGRTFSGEVPGPAVGTAEGIAGYL